MLALPGELTLPVRFALDCALWQSANMGVGLYDALSLIMADKLSIPYFLSRMITDVVCVAVAIPLGGVVAPERWILPSVSARLFRFSHGPQRLSF